MLAYQRYSAERKERVCFTVPSPDPESTHLLVLSYKVKPSGPVCCLGGWKVGDRRIMILRWSLNVAPQTTPDFYQEILDCSWAHHLLRQLGTLHWCPEMVLATLWKSAYLGMRRYFES